MKARSIRSLVVQQSEKPFGRILVFTGARQTGKTTLCRKLFPEYQYLSIEDPVLRARYAQLTAQQWKDLYPRAILDEVQKQAELVESIKSVYDQWEDPRYILTGSSQLLLLDKVRESLAGRCSIIELYPLTLPELRSSSFGEEVPESLFQRCLSTRILAGFFTFFSHGSAFFRETLCMGSLSAVWRLSGVDSI